MYGDGQPHTAASADGRAVGPFDTFREAVVALEAALSDHPVRRPRGGTGFVAAPELERVQTEVQQELDAAVAFAQASPPPEITESTRDVFANP